MPTAPNKYLSADPATRANPVAAALGIHGVTTSVRKNDNYDRIKSDNAEAIGTYRAGIKALMEQKKTELTSLLDALTLTNRQLADLDADIGLKDITTREQFLVNRANRINELKTAYEQHAQQFGAALNDRAIDILQQHSMINAPTLTSIMTGWEMARASQRDNDRVRLENMTKMYEQMSQIEDRAMQIEMDAHKANLQHQRNEAEHAKGLLENQLKVLEDIYGMTQKMEEASLDAGISRTTAAAGAGVKNDTSGLFPGTGSIDDAAIMIGGAGNNQTTQKPAEEKREEGAQQQQGTQQQSDTPFSRENLRSRSDFTREKVENKLRDNWGYLNEDQDSISPRMLNEAMNGRIIAKNNSYEAKYDREKGEFHYHTSTPVSTMGYEAPSDYVVRLSPEEKSDFERTGKLPKFNSASIFGTLSKDINNYSEGLFKSDIANWYKKHDIDSSDVPSSIVGRSKESRDKIEVDLFGFQDTPVEIEAIVR